jgi:mannose-1-phosphate guanylyltransferase
MVLAAGLGTRLRPLSEELPKPLVPIGDRPALAHVLERLRAGGVARAVLNTFHLSAAFSPSRLAALPLPLEVLRETELLGTAGGVANAADRLGAGDVLVWNADVLADVDVGGLFALHEATGAAATLAAIPRAPGEGTVGVGAEGRVVRLRGERFGVELAGADFLGVHVIGAGLRRALPAVGCLVGDVYLPALRAGAALRVLDTAGPWDDVGSVQSYLAANLRWLRSGGAPAFVGAGAVIAAGVRVEDSVIGAGARVDGEGALLRVVVWPGARARAPLADAVVSEAGTVVSAGIAGR